MSDPSLTRPRGGRVKADRLTQRQRDLLQSIRWNYSASESWTVGDVRSVLPLTAGSYKALSAALKRLQARGYIQACGRGTYRLRATGERIRE